MPQRELPPEFPPPIAPKPFSTRSPMTPSPTIWSRPAISFRSERVMAAGRAAAGPTANAPKPHDCVTPGHIFPLRARNGGVLVRAGQTEGSVDLARLAGLKPAGVICEIMKDDGTMARQPDLMKFARKHKLKVVTIADLIQYRLNYDLLLSQAASAPLPTRVGGLFRAIVYNTLVDQSEHLA